MIEILEYILSYIERLSKAISWQLIVVILLFFGRKQIGGVVSSFANLLGKANKFIFDGKTLTIEEVIQKCQEKNIIVKEQEKEINEIQDNIRPKLVIKEIDLNSSLEILKNSNVNISEVDLANTLREKIATEHYIFKTDDDTLKGKFGGKNNVANLLLDAKVEAIPNDLYKIRIILSSTDAANPIIGNVKFFLHHTFNPNFRVVKAENGKAKLTVISYGSFTLGAEYEGKRLELDLADLEGVSEEFKEK